MEYSLNKDSLPKVSCVIDSQGFFINKKFYPREISISNNDIFVSFPVDTEVEFDNLHYREKLSVLYQVQNIHGLTLRPNKNEEDVIPASILKTHLRVLSKIINTSDEKMFAVRNNQFAVWLKEAGFNIINMDKGDYSVPSIKDLDKESCMGEWLCSIHMITDSDVQRCSLRKSLRLWNWIQQKIRDIKEIKMAFN